VGGHRIDRGQDWLKAETQCIEELEGENRELRKANEILKLSSAFFSEAEIARRLKR
jgi:transposase-like protein